MIYSYAPGVLITLLVRLSSISVVSILLVGSATAQSSWSATSGTTPVSMSPGAPSGSYELSGFENVNLFNSRLDFDLPLVHVGGRGAAGFTVHLPIGNQWTEYHYSYPGNCGQGGCGPPILTTIPIPNDWKYLPTFSPGVMAGRQAAETPVASCGGTLSTYAATLTRLTFTDGNGTEYEFRDDLYDGQPKPSTCQATTNRGRIFHSSDGTAATFVSDSDIYDPNAPTNNILTPSGFLLFRDGTRYRIDSGNVSWLRDANGNKITFGGTITDSLGRVVTLTTTTGYYEISFAGVGGSVTRYIRVYTDTLDHLLASGTVQTYLGLFPYLPNASNSSTFNPTIASRVVLPDGRQYSFKYNIYGEIVRIDLPTGGRIEYDFAQPENQSVHHYVTERRVYTDGGITLEGKTRYFAGIVDHLTAADVLLSREKHYFYGTPYGEDLFNNHPTHYSAWDQGREWKTENYAADGTTLLRSVTRTWQQRAAVSWWNSSYGPEPPNNPRVVETVTTLNDTNQVTKTTAIDPQVPHNVGFDQFNNPTDSWEYDYAAGAPSTYPLRHTHTDYLTTNPVNSIDYTLYTGVHIRSLVSAQKTYSVSQANGSETLVAQNSISYDETSSFPIMTYATVTGWIDPASDARGNATSSGIWLNTNSSWLWTHARYDQLGNVRKIWDAKDTALLNPTQIDYTDSFADSLNRNTYSLATTVTSPIPDSTGVYGSTSVFNTTTVFDFSSGAVISSTDINNQTATLQYNDLLDRPTQLRLAFGTSLTHQTTITYDDPNRTITSTTDVATNNDNALKSQTIYDGLGRTIETRQYEGGTNYIAVQQKPYIALQDPDTGAWVSAAQSSNPFRPYLGETAVWTTTFSDALGRASKLRTPDLSIARTSYSGNEVTVTDQTTRKRKSVSDALGRLSKVYEDPTGSNYLTSYEYDALGNLTKVTQDTQPSRTFVYDSLKRLASASNPESGTISYVYDSNGNTTQRTDARGIATNYGYDAINRPTTRTYTDGTPGVTFKYDAASGVTNAKGRIVSVTSSVSTASIGGYDALGRVTASSQMIGSQTYTISPIIYDLLGHVLSETYPSGHTVNYGYDAAARLSSFSGNLGGGTIQTYSTGIIYSSLGGLAKEQFGTDMPVYNKQFYNSRGQLSEIRDSTSYTGPGDTNWNRGAVINHYSDQCWGACNGTDNNGNVKKQDYWIPDNEAVSTFQTYTESFTYDNLNRVSNVSETKYLNGSGSGTQTYTQGYTIDRWGNRTISSATGGVNNAPFEVETGTNRLYAPGDLVLADASRRMRYDTAGNLTTDSYTGSGARSYDAENRMKQAGPTGQLQTYTYDAGGQRVKRSVNGVETWQVYGLGGELIAEYASNAVPSAPQKEYGYRNGQLLITAAQTSTQNISWTNVVGVSVSGNSLTKTAVSAWGNGGAASIQSISSGDGYVECTASQTTTSRMFGLSHGDSNQDYTDIDFAISTNNTGSIKVYEAGVNRGNFGAYATGDVLRVAIEGGVVKYRKNGTLLYTSTVTPTYPLLVDTALYDIGATVSNAVISGNLGGVPDLRWVVMDQLGTPRMVFDKTGILANTKRHDYLPFGEELTTQGGRDTAHGYGSVDGVRQKYTSYERDDETGLDYAHARYYGNVQGRFTSPDPFAGSATIASPQTFNRYAYVGNNPANLNDPTGLYVENTNPHNANTFFGSGDDSVGTMIPGHEGTQFVHKEQPAAAAATGIAPDLVAGAGGTLSHEAGQATPQNPTPDDLIKSGTAEAANRLKIEPCADFFGGGDKGLKALNSLNFSVDSSMPENGHPQAEIRGNNVRVNPNGGLVTPDGVGKTYILIDPKNAANMLTVTLFGADARAFGQLHETGHKGKRFGSTDNDGDRQHIMNGYQNNFKIWKACFSGAPTKPWTGQPPLLP